MSLMKVGIIGLGYVGLPLAVAFAEASVDVVGLDVDHRVVEGLARGESSVEDVPSERLAPLIGERIEVTTDHAQLADCDAIVICVPTPLAHQREPDLAYVDSAARSLAGDPAQGPARRARVDDLSRAPPATGSCRSSRSPACAPAATSTSRSRPSASTRAAPTTRSAPRRSSSAA